MLQKSSIAVEMRKNIENQRFSMLVAIASTKKTPSGTLWKCVCDCGKHVEVPYSQLKNNRRRSCGCAKDNWNRKAPGESACNRVFRLYIRNAKHADRAFTLTKEEFIILTQQNCFYCGGSPTSIYEYKTFGAFTYNGIDRVDNNKGYETDNVVTCCSSCNMMKKTLDQKTFIQQCKNIAEKHA